MPDLILGGMRSIQARYLMPCYLGIPLAVAYLLANASPYKPEATEIWQLVLLVIITGSILSCAVSSQAEFWWNKSLINTDIIPSGCHC